MATVTIEIPDDIPLSHTYSEAVMQSTRVVNAMARWFGVDVKAAVSVERDTDGDEKGKVISFSFAGDKADQARKNVASFINDNPDIKDVFIRPEKSDKSGDASVKMDLDTLSKYKSDAFDAAAHDAEHHGSLISRRVSGEQGKGKSKV